MILEMFKVSYTVKPVLNSLSKIDKTTIGSLMKIESVAEWRLKVLKNAPLGVFWNTFDLH